MCTVLFSMQCSEKANGLDSTLLRLLDPCMTYGQEPAWCRPGDCLCISEENLTPPPALSRSSLLKQHLVPL